MISSKIISILNHTIVSKDALNNEVGVNLIFIDPAEVSNTAVIIYLMLTFIDLGYSWG